MSDPQGVNNASGATLEHLRQQIDMEQLKQFNPKLYAQIRDEPESLLKLQEIFAEHEQASDAVAAESNAESLAAANESLV